MPARLDGLAGEYAIIKELMLKQKTKKILRTNQISGIFIVGAILFLSIFAGGFVLADQYDEQIRALQEQNNTNQQAANRLAAEAASYQDAVDKLSAQINNLRQAILDNQHQSNQLQQQIDQQQAELVHQKQVLGENIKTMYLEGQISTLEILASSKDLSDFVNKQQYRNSVQSKIKATVDKITELKLELEQKQRQIRVLIKEQEIQQAQLASDYNQQNELLSYTEGQRVTYNQQIKNNQAKISELRRAQAIENARLFGGGQIIQTSRCDIYPQNWCNAPMDSIVDTWGMYNRECVSWTAYRVAASGRYMPYWGGRGNANQWDDNAIASGIPVDRSPQVGDVAISNSGYYGHSMYVEAVNDDGSIAVSQFNHDWNGTYSFVPKMPIGNLVFIHF